MSWFEIFDGSFLAFVLIIHVFVLKLLFREKKTSKTKIQLYLVIALFITESTAILFILTDLLVVRLSDSLIIVKKIAVYIRVWLINFIFMYLRLLFYMFIVLLTVDRFLVFYYNIKYMLYCKPRQLMKLIYLIMSVSFFMVVLFTLGIHFKYINFRKSVKISNVIYVILDSLHILIVTSTYIYIFIVYKKHVKKQNTRWQKYKHFKLLVPTLIIATYMVFTFIPDFIRVFISYKVIVGSKKMLTVTIVAYRVGWLIDPVVYSCYLFYGKCKSRRTPRVTMTTNSEITM